MDDILALGHPDDVKQIEADLQNAFVSKSEGKMKDTLVTKLMWFFRVMEGLKLRVQKLWDMFDLPGGKTPKTPAVPSQVLVKGDGSDTLNPQDTTKYCSGMALCMYKMQWSRPDIYNATQDYARHMSVPNEFHVKALKHILKSVVGMTD